MEEGHGRPEDLDLLARHCKWMAPGNTFCHLAPGAVEPLQSALKYFRDDFEQHVQQQRCPWRDGQRDDTDAQIYIENRPYDVPEGKNMLHACLSLGFNIPYFCWHPGMHSVGACRQCAVKQFKDENDKQGKIVMACMLHATEGTRISIRDARKRRSFGRRSPNC